MARLFETRPQWYSFDELSQELNESDLLDLLELCLNTSSLYLHLRKPGWHPMVPDKPRAPAVARLQAQLGNQVTNLRHEAIEITDNERALLRELDGNHTTVALGKKLDLDAATLARRICHLALLEN